MGRGIRPSAGAGRVSSRLAWSRVFAVVFLLGSVSVGISTMPMTASTTRARSCPLQRPCCGGEGEPAGASERGGQTGRREMRFLEGVVRWRKRRSRSTVAGRLADTPEPFWQPVRSAILAYWEGR